MINNNYLKAAQNHYSKIASIYRQLRITDIEPVQYIKIKLDHLDEIKAADVGCGAGRYAKLLFDELIKDLRYLVANMQLKIINEALD